MLGPGMLGPGCWGRDAGGRKGGGAPPCMRWRGPAWPLAPGRRLPGFLARFGHPQQRNCIGRKLRRFPSISAVPGFPRPVPGVSPGDSRSFPRERIPACAVKEFLPRPAAPAQEPAPIIFKIFAGPQGCPQGSASYPPGKPAVHRGIHKLIHRAAWKVAEGSLGMFPAGRAELAPAPRATDAGHAGRRLFMRGSGYPQGPRAGPAVSRGRPGLSTGPSTAPSTSSRPLGPALGWAVRREGRWAGKG